MWEVVSFRPLAQTLTEWMGNSRYISEHLRNDLCTVVYYRSDADTLEVMTSAPTLALEDSAYLLSSQLDSSGALHYTGSFFSP